MTFAASFAVGLANSVRLLRTQKAFVAAIVGTAALSLGGNAALYGIVDGIFFRPLPYREADRLVYMELKPQTFLRLAVTDRGRIGALSPDGISLDLLSESAYLRTDDEIEAATAVSRTLGAVRATAVSPSFFETLGVRADLGRTFVATDAMSAPRPIVLSFALWRRAFGANPGVVGTVADIPGARSRGSCLVVGVMPPGFHFPKGTDLWLASPRPVAPVGVGLLGRARPGITVPAIRARWPEFSVVPLQEFVRPENATVSAFLLLASTGLLFVAWLQGGSLFLARALKRMPEFGLRTALGSTRGQLKIACVAETMSLLTMAGGLACLLAPALNALAVRVLPAELTADQLVSVSGRTVALTMATALLGGVILGAVQSSLLGAGSTTFSTAGGALAMTGLRYRRLRSALFCGQIAAVTALLYLTALVASSYVRLSVRPLGFLSEAVWGVTLPRFDLPSTADRGAGPALFAAHSSSLAEAVREIAARPEVVATSTTSVFPMEESALAPALARPEADPHGEWTDVRIATVGRGIVKTLGVALLSGAEATPSEAAGLPRTAVPDQRGLALVTSTLARRLEPFGSPVGQMLVVGPFRRVKIVGVVPDVRIGRPDEAPTPTILEFAPEQGRPRLLVRVRDERVQLEPIVRAAVRRVWGPRADFQVVAVDRLVSAASSGYRARVIILSLIAFLSLPVAALGLAGAVAHACAERRREFGIRLAVGATPRSLRAALGRQLAGLAALGITAGVAAGLSVGHAMRSMLFGVSPSDPGIAALVTCVVVVVVSLATVVPAMRATSFDAVRALKGEGSGLSER